VRGLGRQRGGCVREDRPDGGGSGARFEEAIVHCIDIDLGPGRAPSAVVPAIDVVGLERRYGDFHAVRGISFEVHAGEVFALLGVNGTGKTSALEVVEGLSAPSGGCVRVLGRDPRRDRAGVRRHVGVLLQHSGLSGDLTVRETVQTWARTLTDPPRSPRPWSRWTSPVAQTSACAPCPGVSAEGWTWRWRCSAVRASWSWTSRPRAWTRRADAPSG
jgi:ABC transporter